MSKLVTARIPAAALSIALGVSIVAVPQMAEPAPATAQEASEASNFSPSNIHFKSLTDRDGNKIESGVVTNNPKAIQDGIYLENGARVNYTIDVPADTKPGDAVWLGFSAIRGDNSDEWISSAMLFTTPHDIVVDGKVIAKADPYAEGLRISFTDEIGSYGAINGVEVASGVTTSTYRSWRAGYAKQRAEEGLEPNKIMGPSSVDFTVREMKSTNDGSKRSTTFVEDNYPDNPTSSHGSVTNLSFQQAVSAVSHDDAINLKRYVGRAMRDSASTEESLILDGYITVPINDPEIYKNASDTYTFTVAPSSGFSDKYPDWKFNRNYKITRVTEGATVKSQKFNPDGTITITLENVAPSTQPRVYFDNIGRVSGYIPGKYTLLLKNDPFGTVVYNHTGKQGVSAYDDLTKLHGDAELTGFVDGKNAGNANAPIPVAGTKKTVKFAVKNTGNVPIVAPELTFPDGTVKTLEDVTIPEGETKTVSVEYDFPEDETVLNWKFESAFMDKPAGYTMYVGPKDTSAEDAAEATKKQQEALDKIAKELEEQKKQNADQNSKLDELNKKLDENNKLTGEQNKAIKDQTKTIKDGLDAQKDAIDKQTAAIDKVKQAIESGDKELADKLDEQTKALKEQNQAIKDQTAKIGASLDAVKKSIDDGNAAALAESKKQTAELAKNTAALKDQTAKLSEKLDNIDAELGNQTAELKKHTAELEKQVAALNKQVAELEGIKAQLAKSNKLTEATNAKLQAQIDESKKQTDALNGLIAANKDQTNRLEAQLGALTEVQKKQIQESIDQSKYLERIAKALERANELSISQHRDQLAQWKIENGFSKDEQDMRHHSSKLGRCISTDPALPLMILIPAGLAAAFNMPGMDGLVKSAGDQIGRMNMDIQRATGINNAIPADIQSAINSFNHNYGNAVTTGAITLGGLTAAVGAAIGINNLINNCFDEADDEVGRERTPRTPLKDSAVLPRETETAEYAAAEDTTA